MNKIKRIVSLVLVLCMVMAFLPLGVSAAQADGYDYSIVHVDAGRKYFSPASLKTIIDNAAAAGYNQVELYLSDNQGFRFALDDMTLTTAYGSYDLTPALGDGYSDGSKYPDYSGEYLTQSEMDEIIAYAHEKGIDIVPCINVPGHMGAILEEFTGFRYKKNNATSKSSIDLGNEEAVAFALGLTEKYASYFASRGCKFYNVGADEFANDLSSMGFEGMGSTMYTKFVQFLNDAAEIVTGLGMTPRAFNDGFYYKDYSISIEPSKAYEICYWSSGWNGYDVATASTIAAKGHKMINTDGDYYWVLGNSTWQCSASKASGFNYTKFSGSTTISKPAGAMFCIWSDVGNTNGQDGGTSVVSKTASVIAAFGKVLPTVESLVSAVTPEPEQDVVLTDDVSGAILVAPGLTDLTVTEAEAPAIEGASKAVAWDIVPETADGLYTGAAEVSVPVPDDFHIAWLGAFVVNADGTVEKLEGSYLNGMFTYTCPHFSVTGIYDASAVAEGGDESVVLEERTITVNVGSSATDVITGGQYSADKTELNESIATVSVTTAPGQNGTVTYTAVTGLKCSNLISSNGNKVATNYYHLVNGSYYPVYATRSGSFSYTYTWHYSTDNGNTYVQIGNTQSGSSWSNPDLNFTPYTKSGTEPVAATTTVTFRGVALGTTYVTVGNVRYTINVVDQAPDNALKSTSVTLEYWITNLKVTCNRANSTTILTTTAGVNTAEGAELTSIAGATGTWDYGDVVYWKSVRLDSNNQQTTAANDDETADGTVMTHIRYYNGAWQYKTTDGNWNYFVSGDQLVAYYLMPTTITDQITTLTKDWGYDPSSNTDKPSDGQVALSFAVVDGNTLTPSESNIFAQSTTIFNYWSGRDIGVVAPLNNSNYEIYKITVTAGKRSGSTSNNWSSGAPTWNKVDNELGSGQWFDEREVWNISEGTDPMVNGKNDNIVWTAKNTAYLILFYVRAKNAELTVKYVDDSQGGTIITQRGVFANGGENFFNLKQTSPVPTTNSAFTLDDNATLTYLNVDTGKNVAQTFEKSLLAFQDIPVQYRSGIYEYKSAEIADDGKTLILHYNINSSKLRKSFVVDFGLKMSIPMNEIVEEYGSAQVLNAAFGTATVTGGHLVYTPNAVIQSEAAVTLKVDTNIFNIAIVPATTVYYEEGFASFTGSWTTGSTGTGEQAFKGNNYGYDGKYAAEIGMSNGTQAVSTSSGDTAELSFTGTGIDVYANCDSTTSVMAALLYDVNDKIVRIYQVDTKTKDGNSDVTIGQNMDSVALPVVSIQGLDRGAYKLVLQHTKVPGNPGEIRLDGYRVYNTLTGSDAYAEGEKNPTFLELRDNVLAGLIAEVDGESNFNQYVEDLYSQVYSASGTTKGAVVLGSNPDVQDLLDNGPKNELFLHNGESLTINLGSATAQIGLKAVNGAVEFTIANGPEGAEPTSATISSSTDMFYYDLTGTVVITNKSDNLLSVTKLKLFGKKELEPLTPQDIAYTLYVMGMTEQQIARPGAPIANPFADVAEDSFYYDAVLWAVGNGITTGADETHFLPDAVCQRASVVTFLWRAAGSPEPVTTVNPFLDVEEDHYFYKAVLWALENGITTGVDATHFAPLASCSRAQVVTFLWRAKGSPAVTGTAPFADVAEGQWYTDAVLWAVENGITNGMSANTFGVENACNRAQIVTFLYRASK